MVATLTFRRPAELDRLLPLLVDQADAITPRPRLVVVDNDPEASARAAVENWSAAGVEYAHEPREGIAAARNRAIEAAGDAPAVVFIDDDETPLEGWLERLVALWQRDRPAVVTGPAIKVVDGDADPWIRASGFLERWKFETGTRVPGGATNNILFDTAYLRAQGLAFDDRYGLTGGSDSMLLWTITQRGGQILWCDEAQVLDPMSAARTTRAWVLRRSFRTGNTWGRVTLDLADHPTRVRVRMIASSASRIAVRGAAATAGRLSGRLAQRARNECEAAVSAGALAAALGYAYTEYSRVQRPSARRMTSV